MSIIQEVQITRKLDQLDTVMTPTKTSMTSTASSTPSRKRKVDTDTESIKKGKSDPQEMAENKMDIVQDKSVDVMNSNSTFSFGGATYADPEFYLVTKHALLLKKQLVKLFKTKCMDEAFVKVFVPEGCTKPVMRCICCGNGLGNTIRISKTFHDVFWDRAYVKDNMAFFYINLKDLTNSTWTDITSDKQELHWLMGSKKNHVFYLPAVNKENFSSLSEQQSLEANVSKEIRLQLEEGVIEEVTEEDMAKGKIPILPYDIETMEDLDGFVLWMDGGQLIKAIESLEKSSNGLTIVLSKKQVVLKSNSKSLTLERSLADSWPFETDDDVSLPFDIALQLKCLETISDNAPIKVVFMQADDMHVETMDQVLTCEQLRIDSDQASVKAISCKTILSGKKEF